jgi:hypothetical protein
VIRSSQAGPQVRPWRLGWTRAGSGDFRSPLVYARIASSGKITPHIRTRARRSGLSPAPQRRAGPAGRPEQALIRLRISALDLARRASQGACKVSGADRDHRAGEEARLFPGRWRAKGADFGPRRRFRWYACLLSQICGLSHDSHKIGLALNLDQHLMADIHRLSTKISSGEGRMILQGSANAPSGAAADGPLCLPRWSD